VTSRSSTRVQLGAAAVLSEAEAVQLLPCRDDTARAWLRDQGLVRQHPVLGRIVVWADVVAAIQGPPPDDAPTGAPSGLPRLTLRRRR
jgi:hypothetical protein